MRLIEAQKKTIRDTAYQAIREALEGVDTSERLNLYYEAVEACKAGVCSALLDYTSQNQSAAASLGGINRATMRVNIKRHNLI